MPECLDYYRMLSREKAPRSQIDIATKSALTTDERVGSVSVVVGHVTPDPVTSVARVLANFRNVANGDVLARLHVEHAA